MMLHSICAEKFRPRLRVPAPDYSALTPTARVAAKCKDAKRAIDTTETGAPTHHSLGWRYPDAALVGRNRVGVVGHRSLGFTGGVE